MTHVAKMANVDGRITMERLDRATFHDHGNTPFKSFYRKVLELPQVDDLKEDVNLKFSIADSDVVYRRFKDAFVNMIFASKHSLFIDRNGEIVTPTSALENVRIADVSDIHQWYVLTFTNGEKVTGRLLQSKVWEVMTTDPKIYSKLGREMSVALEYALAMSGCEAIVEGFYSVVKHQKQAGGQLNVNLIHRAIIDYVLPDPIQCPGNIVAITKKYLTGDPERGLGHHLMVTLTNYRDRDVSTTSKVFERLKSDDVRCPFTVDRASTSHKK